MCVIHKNKNYENHTENNSKIGKKTKHLIYKTTTLGIQV